MKFNKKESLYASLQSLKYIFSAYQMKIGQRVKFAWQTFHFFFKYGFKMSPILTSRFF